MSRAWHLTPRTVHLCIDMQRLFSSDGPWPTPWMERVLPRVAAIAARFPDRTVFTKFITPRRPEDMHGTWRKYYRRWEHTTRERLDPRLLDLMPELAKLVPPAVVFPKPVYSAFAGRALHQHLAGRGADALLVTGAETDVCVLATVLGAIDRGYRVIVVRDAVCSFSDEGHDALVQLFERRFTEQLEVIDAESALAAWPRS